MKQKTFILLRISLLYVYHSPVFSRFPFDDTDSRLTASATRLTIRAISYTLFNVESLSRYLSTHFESLNTNMYYVGPSDDAVVRYILMLEIYGATSV